jgi:hypothetical protein
VPICCAPRSPFSYDSTLVPSYTLRLLVDHVLEEMSEPGEHEEKRALLSVVEGALEAEKEHLLKAVDSLLDQFEERLEAQMMERMEAVDAFFEALDEADETDTRSPRELADELTALAVVPLRLSQEHQRGLRENPYAVKEEVREQIEMAVNAQGVVRLVGAIERRMGESLEMNASQLAGADWADLADKVYEAVSALMDRRSERLLGNGAPGQVVKDLEAALAKEKEPLTSKDRQLLVQAAQEAIDSSSLPQQSQEGVLSGLRNVLRQVDGGLSEEDKEGLLDRIDASMMDSSSTLPQPEAVLAVLNGEIDALKERSQENRLARMLMLMPVGTQTSFDRKTHRRVQTRTLRFSYTYYASRLLDNTEYDEVAAAVLEHLENANSAMQRAWGRMEWKRLSSMRMGELDEIIQTGLRKALTGESYELYKEQPMESLPGQVRETIVCELGRQSLTEIYRQLMLGVITELWVEYLTQMEALRVSIGLEAYGQRDPLVQYKSKASGLFQELLSNMRLGVITRMFTYRPRDLSGLQLVVRRREEVNGDEPEMLEAETGEGEEAVEQPEKEGSGETVQKESTQPAAPAKAKKQDAHNVSKSARRRRGRR